MFAFIIFIPIPKLFQPALIAFFQLTLYDMPLLYKNKRKATSYDCLSFKEAEE